MIQKKKIQKYKNPIPFKSLRLTHVPPAYQGILSINPSCIVFIFLSSSRQTETEYSMLHDQKLMYDAGWRTTNALTGELPGS